MRACCIFPQKVSMPWQKIGSEILQQSIMGFLVNVKVNNFTGGALVEPKSILSHLLLLPPASCNWSLTFLIQMFCGAHWRFLLLGPTIDKLESSNMLPIQPNSGLRSLSCQALFLYAWRCNWLGGYTPKSDIFCQYVLLWVTRSMSPRCLYTTPVRIW